MTIQGGRHEIFKPLFFLWIEPTMASDKQTISYIWFHFCEDFHQESFKIQTLHCVNAVPSGRADSILRYSLNNTEHSGLSSLTIQSTVDSLLLQYRAQWTPFYNIQSRINSFLYNTEQNKLLSVQKSAELTLQCVLVRIPVWISTIQNCSEQTGLLSVQ